MDTTLFRNGIRIKARDGFCRLVIEDGVWYMSGSCKYSDVRVDRADAVGGFEINPQSTLDYDLLHSNPIFVRLGGLPQDGYSINHPNGGLEKGVSAFRAAWDGDTLVVEANAGAILFDTDRPLYEISGTVCGCGSDDEPLLYCCKILRELNRDCVRFSA